MSATGPRREAIVLGASMGGLLAARALSNHFDRVTLLERDPVHLQPESRKGQPQTRHLHGLLATGLNILTHYFPDLPAAGAASGAMVADFAEAMHWYTAGGYRKSFKIGFDGMTMSRPLLEHLVRERVLANPRVRLLDSTAVTGLIATEDRRLVTGVSVEQRDRAEPATSLSADLIVDATGRGSRTPKWLQELGYEAPLESEVKVNIAYATRFYRRDPQDPLTRKWIFYTPDAPRETRFSAAFPVEGDRWIAAVGGWHGDHAATDEAAHIRFASELPSQDVYRIFTTCEPLSDILPARVPSSLRRHYEKMSRFPEGFLVLGDAVSSFNPTYGQGMTSAALQVRALDQLLAQNGAVTNLARAFFTRAAKVVDIPWQLAVGEDFRFPQTTGPKPAGTDMINRYVRRVHRATLRDEVVCGAFLRVMNLMEPATSLFAPRILRRVLAS